VRASDIPQITKLSTPGKILLLEDLWDSIASEESVVPVPQSHKEELDRRVKQFQTAPGGLLSMDELRARIESRR
jgi:putative addiction module component (TIGR02574 family)